jgi:hypothetical protein
MMLQISATGITRDPAVRAHQASKKPLALTTFPLLSMCATFLFVQTGIAAIM